jgi:hypothetical protein
MIAWQDNYRTQRSKDENSPNVNGIRVSSRWFIHDEAASQRTKVDRVDERIRLDHVCSHVFFASERFSLAVGLFFGVAAVPLMARYSIRKTFRDPANANMFVPRDYELTETSLSATTEIGTTRMSWSSFTQVVELPTVIVMQETKLSAVMIGTGQLTKMQLQELRQLLRLHFPDAKLGEGIG